MTVSAMPFPRIAASCEDIMAEVATVVVGMEESVKTALSAILAGGHVLFEDVPGLGKTLTARTLATALGLNFQRLQCTPDLLPSDITGSSVFDPRRGEFEFRAGPVFTDLLLADEINRTAPKTQSALLEAMAERQVTVDGTTYALNPPFHVIATSNPVEYEGTYPLPEAQLDRFMVRVAAGYPGRDQEIDVVARRLARKREETSVRRIVEPGALLAMQAGIEELPIEQDVVAYCIDLAAATRSHAAVEIGASPRGSIALVLVARARAALSGRDFVTPEDIKAIAVPALAHRITLTPQSWASGLAAQDLVTQLLASVPTPPSLRGR